MPDYKLLEKPLTEAEIKERDCKIACVIPVPLNDVIDFDVQILMDIFETTILETGVLMDIEYNMVGAEPHPVDLIHFHVRANVELY